MVYASLLVPGMIMFESFLSLLGLGRARADDQLGFDVARRRDFDGSCTLAAARAEFLLGNHFVLFHFIGDGLRDALDPKDR